MKTLAPGISYIDVQFLGVPDIIATAVLHGPGGVALVDPAPSSTLPTLRAAAGRTLAEAYTPGHAAHHVSYYDRDSGVAFVGATAGIRRGQNGFGLPPTPRPDIELEAWRDSLKTSDRWRAETLFVTHFGPH